MSGIPFEAGHANRVKLANTQMTEQILVWIVFGGGLARDRSRAAESIFFVIFSKEAEKDTNMKKWQKQKDHTDERSLFPALSI